MYARALLVLLAVLNLGVGAWWWAHAPASSRAAAAEVAGVAALQLASERSTEAAPAAAAPVPLPEDAACIALGPFGDATSAARAQTQLAPQVLTSRLVERAAGTVRGWRVLVPPQPTRAEADAVAARIAAAGFSDLFVLRQGADTNAVALGLYQAEATARRRAGALAAAGFDARAEPVGTTLEPWLEIALPAGADAAPLATLAAVPRAEPTACDPLR
ncbi:SPOR domain-containing protein [Cognatilysobacter bugurensis]|uniref:SPOR domain-containing protein n=1 Tax=Cognatilysobacter bugurensis TaxID=543356 RepID=A0A918T169_9GAMM|nr:SPOR domain-containing protein [Lysobacter bugurensis]GHA83793.1 hypothetical protein GCM10007067_22400 [Lysobacter bugurensis]